MASALFMYSYFILKFYKLYFIIIVCVSVWECGDTCVWRSEDNLDN